MIKASSILLILMAILILLLVKTYFLPLMHAPSETIPPKERIILPEPRLKSVTSIEEAIAKRRSIREYSKDELTLKEISQLLWAAQGITNEKGFRTAPSAGALYPIEIYLVTKKGVFKYEPLGHYIYMILKGDVRNELAKAALGQDWVAKAPVSIVITGVYERTAKKYGNRGERYVLMEAGHVSQNIYLQCTSLGLGTVAVGAFYDLQVQEVLKIPKDHRPLYIMPVGRKK
jgi:SagB-type dehydrogenase family enzyme